MALNQKDKNSCGVGYLPALILQHYGALRLYHFLAEKIRIRSRNAPSESRKF